MAISVGWTGDSGQKYNFEIYPIGQEFNPVSGLYIFCKAIRLDSWLALYVGETQSFKDRLNTGLQNHDGFKRARELGANHVGVMRAGNISDRLSIETDLRHGLKPQCNEQGTKSTLTSLFD